MAEPNIQSTSSTNVHDEETEHVRTPPILVDLDLLQSSCAHAEPWSAVNGTPTRAFLKSRAPRSYATSERGSFGSNTSTFFDDDLAETRSAPSLAVSTRGASNKLSTLIKSRSCNDLSLHISSFSRHDSFGEHNLDRVQKKARSACLEFVDDIRKALYQRPTFLRTPSWDGTTARGSSSTGSRTLVGVALDDDIQSYAESTYGGSTLLPSEVADTDAPILKASGFIAKPAPLLDSTPSEDDIDRELLRLSQEKSHSALISCAFCASMFYGTDRQQKCIDHILEAHQTVEESPVSLKHPALYPNELTKLSVDVKEKRPSTNPSKIIDFASNAAVRPVDLSCRMAYDLFAIGSWCQDELWIQREAARPITAAVVLTGNTQPAHVPDTKALLDTIVSLSSSIDSEAGSDKVNDLFNGLDLVVEDLARRFPENETVRDIRDTLASLGQGFDPSSATCAPYNTTPHTAGPSGVKSCPVSQHSESSYSCSHNPRLAGGENEGGNVARGSCGPGGRLSSGNDYGPSPTVSVEEAKKKPKTRHLACPFRKHDEVHGLRPSCNYPGAGSMSELNGHLKGNEHSHALACPRLCRTCWDYIIDRSEWQNLHHTKLCTRHLGRSNTQIRGSGAVKQWQRLYIRIFPQSQRIPHAYNHINEWTSKDVWLRRQSADPTTANTHLDFDFNEPTTTPRYRARFNQQESVPSPRAEGLTVDAPPNDQNNHVSSIARSNSIETIQVDHRAETTAPEIVFSNYHETFLDQVQAVASEQTMTASRMPYSHDPHVYGSGTAVMHDSRHGQPDATGVHDTRPDNRLPLSSTESTRTAVDTPSPAVMHLQSQESGSVPLHVPTLLLVVESLKGCLDGLATSDWAIRAARFSQANRLTLEESDVVGDDLLATIGRLASEIHATAASNTREHEHATTNITRRTFHQSRVPFLFSTLRQDQAMLPVVSEEDVVHTHGTLSQTNSPVDIASAVFQPGFGVTF